MKKINKRITTYIHVHSSGYLVKTDFHLSILTELFKDQLLISLPWHSTRPSELSRENIDQLQEHGDTRISSPAVRVTPRALKSGILLCAINSNYILLTITSLASFPISHVLRPNFEGSSKERSTSSSCGSSWSGEVPGEAGQCQ